MTHVALLGLGAMGARMAARLVAAGHAVTVYNRTPRTLEGAEVASSPAEAARGASFVLSMVRDDEASRAVWFGEGGAAGAMAADAIAVEHSTLSAAGIASLASAFAERGVAWVEAPVVGTRPHAEGGKLTVFAGGDAASVERARPIFEAFAERIVHLGAHGAGARAKLVVNAAYAAQVAIWSQLLGLAANAGWPVQDAVGLLAELPVTSPAASLALRAIAAESFAPMFPVELVAKDLGYATALGEASLIEAAREAFEAAVAAGHGDENITAVAKLYV